MVEFRKANGRPFKDAAGEVMAQACSRMPHLCHESYRPSAQPVATLKGKVLHWLSQFAQISKRGTLGYVREGEMLDRVGRCSTCPHQRRLPNSCAACIAAIGAHSVTILKKDHKPDKRVSACEVLGIYLPVATWLDEVTVANDSLPGHCWRKKS